MDTYKYLIIGGGMAGERAAEGIRKADEDGPIALVTEEPHLPYDRPPLSKGYLVGKEGLDSSVRRAWTRFTCGRPTFMPRSKLLCCKASARRPLTPRCAR
jgi:hypothetical protein